MLQFQSVNPGGIGPFYIKISEIVIQYIPNLDPKGLGVSKSTIVHRIYI